MRLAIPEEGPERLAERIALSRSANTLGSL
jgi:hypothetical protein